MDGKWWEYYVVRYLVGTVVGAGLIAFLNAYPGSPYEWSLSSFGEFEDAKFTGVSLLAALGFAFCYVSSAPVLTLHAMRAHLRISIFRASWLKLGSLLIACIAGTSFIGTLILPTDVAWILGVVLGLQLFLILCAVVNNSQKIETFYFSIAGKRAIAAVKTDDRPTRESEYVTSYRHLREHGNAFFILFLEAALAYILYKLPNATCAFPVIVAWILPSCSVWFLGTVLEMRLADRP